MEDTKNDAGALGSNAGLGLVPERATPSLARRLLDVACRIRVGETLYRDDELVDAAAHELVRLTAELAAFTPLRAKGVVDADDNLDCWDTNPYDICTRHVKALNEKDPNAMWRVVDLFARDEEPSLATRLHSDAEQATQCEPLRRLWPLIERAMKDYVFTGDKAGEVAADMAALRKFLEA